MTVTFCRNRRYIRANDLLAMERDMVEAVGHALATGKDLDLVWARETTLTVTHMDRLDRHGARTHKCWVIISPELGPLITVMVEL